MKKRITLTIDPLVAKRAKKVARTRNTSVSGLVEDLLRSVPLSGERRSSFVERWTGKFSIADSPPDDQRMAYLKARYRLNDK